MQSMTDALADGLVHHRAGRLGAAEALYRGVLRTAPDQPNALHLYGVLLSGRDDPAAFDVLARAVQARPGNPESRLALANLHYRRGEVARACALWREVLKVEPGHVAATLNLAGQLRTTLQWREAVDLCRHALAYQPRSAPLWLGLASALLAGQVFVPALTAANAAVELDSDLAEAWLIRGTVLARTRDRAALHALQRAVALDPTMARAELHLGNALLDLDRVEEAEPHMRRAVDLAPDLPEAHTSLGFLECSRHRIAASIACHERALVLRPEFPEAHSNLAAALLLAGNYARGLAEYEWRKRDPLFEACYWKSDQPQWTGEDLAGRTLLVFCEQGFGDTIMCARYLPMLAARGARLVLVCTAPLIALLRDLPGVAEVVPRGDPCIGARVAADAIVPGYDVWVDQMSLPLRFGTRVDAIGGAAGYLRADAEQVRTWRAALPTGFKVGLVWAGNPAHHNDHRRSMTFGQIEPLLTIAGVHLVSLQCGARQADASRAGVHDVAAGLTDFEQTAAVLCCLDLVICVDTAVAHLAGALGVSCWLLLPFAPEWRWLLGRDDTPWYASLRLFRQTSPGDWDGVVTAVAGALRARIAAAGAAVCVSRMAPAVGALVQGPVT